MLVHLKFEILSARPVESSLLLVRIAEFHRANTKQTVNNRCGMCDMRYEIQHFSGI